MKKPPAETSVGGVFFTLGISIYHSRLSQLSHWGTKVAVSTTNAR